MYPPGGEMCLMKIYLETTDGEREKGDAWLRNRMLDGDRRLLDPPSLVVPSNDPQVCGRPTQEAWGPGG